MRIRRFNETVEENLVSTIEDLLVDFSDNGFITSVKGIAGVYIIHIRKYTGDINSKDIIENLLDLYNKSETFGLVLDDTKSNIEIKPSCNIKIFLRKELEGDYTINNPSEFLDYLETVMNLEFMETYGGEYIIVIPGYAIFYDLDKGTFVIGEDDTEFDADDEFFDYITDIVGIDMNNLNEFKMDKSGIEVIKDLINRYNKSKKDNY